MKASVQTALNEPHPEVGLLLSSYQDGLLTLEERADIEQHLTECEACRNFLSELEQVRKIISDLPSASNSSNHAEYKAVMLRTIYREKVAQLEKTRRFFQKNLAKQQKAERKANQRRDTATQKAEHSRELERDWQDSEKEIKR